MTEKYKLYIGSGVIEKTLRDFPQTSLQLTFLENDGKV